MNLILIFKVTSITLNFVYLILNLPVVLHDILEYYSFVDDKMDSTFELFFYVNFSSFFYVSIFFNF